MAKCEFHVFRSFSILLSLFFLSRFFVLLLSRSRSPPLSLTPFALSKKKFVCFFSHCSLTAVFVYGRYPSLTHRADIRKSYNIWFFCFFFVIHIFTNATGFYFICVYLRLCLSVNITSKIYFCLFYICVNIAVKSPLSARNGILVIFITTGVVVVVFVAISCCLFDIPSLDISSDTINV